MVGGRSGEGVNKALLWGVQKKFRKKRNSRKKGHSCSHL